MKRSFLMKKIYPALMLMIFFIVLFVGTGRSFSDNSNIPNIIKIAQVSDVHIDLNGKNKTSRMYGSSVALLEDAVKQINKDKKINTVVFSGDMINKPSEEAFYKFISIVKNLNPEWYGIYGNHDIGVYGGFSKDRFYLLLRKYIPEIETDKTYYSIVPKKGYLLVFLDGTIGNRITANGYFPTEELDWLDKELDRNKDKKVIIVQHFPVVEPIHSNTHQVLNTDEYFKVIDKHSNVVAVLSGHYHKQKVSIRKKVAHVSAPALVQYPNAYRIVKITTINDKVKLETELVETNLKDIQKQSLSKIKSPELYKIKNSEKKFSVVLN